jgi:hypothetical protein
MGLSPEEISSMPAALIAQATTQRLSLEDIKAKAEETENKNPRNAEANFIWIKVLTPRVEPFKNKALPRGLKKGFKC